MAWPGRIPRWKKALVWAGLLLVTAVVVRYWIVFFHEVFTF